MGMAASQARYLSLVARQSNIQYQGQQINQERTVLSQQCTALYNTLLDLQVPTPPSTSDYTKVVYSGHDGATSFTVGNVIPHRDSYSIDFLYQKTGHYIEEAGQASVIATPRLRLNLITGSDLDQTGTHYYEITAAAQQDLTSYTTPSATGVDTIMEYLGTVNTSGGYTPAPGTYYVLENNIFREVLITASNASDYNGKDLYSVTDGATYTGALSHVDQTKDYLLGNDTALMNPSNGCGYNKNDIIGAYYIVENGTYRTITDSDFSDNNSTPFVKLDDGTYKFNSTMTSSMSLALRSEAQRVDDDVTGPDVFGPHDTDLIGIVAGKDCYKLKNAVTKGLISSTSIDEYIEAIRNALPEYADKEEYSDADIKDLFGVYCTRDSETGRLVPHFVIVQEVLSHIGDANDTHYISTYDYLANGRFEAVENKKDCLLEFDVQGRITSVKVPTYADDGSVATYKTISLSAETKTDEEAYEDAYNKYQYSQHLYDKKQQEINRMTEIIQQEDRNLEMKLTRLDNEEKAVKTELDAVKKVIEENIDKSFKTFSG